MCGIAGFIGSGTRADLERMTAALVHRGPDEEGYVESDGTFLGHRRLVVLDRAGGHQPMWTADGNHAIVFNGEIYNHAQLRAELEAEGIVFRSDHSDTETLLLGYAHWGESVCARLNGMFAFAIWDRRKNRLFLARDRFGQKPLFYHARGELFAFASELTALTAHGNVTGSVSERALQKYFAHGYIPAPGSLYEGSAKLPGGWQLTWDARTGRLETKPFWRFTLAPEPMTDEAQAADQLREKLDRAVARHLVADVPLGVLPARRPRSCRCRRAGSTPHPTRQAPRLLDRFPAEELRRARLVGDDGRTPGLAPPSARARCRCHARPDPRGARQIGRALG